MTNIAISVADIVNKANGLTVREENMQMQHGIPLWALVEIKQFDMEEPEDSEYNQHTGLRLFVCGHTRDCDGTPLYTLTHNTKIRHESVKRTLEDAVVVSNGFGSVKGSIFIPGLDGFSEDCLTVIRLPSIKL